MSRNGWMTAAVECRWAPGCSEKQLQRVPWDFYLKVGETGAARHCFCFVWRGWRATTWRRGRYLRDEWTLRENKIKTVFRSSVYCGRSGTPTCWWAVPQLHPAAVLIAFRRRDCCVVEGGSSMGVVVGLPPSSGLVLVHFGCFLFGGGSVIGVCCVFSSWLARGWGWGYCVPRMGFSIEGRL